MFIAKLNLNSPYKGVKHFYHRKGWIKVIRRKINHPQFSSEMDLCSVTRLLNSPYCSKKDNGIKTNSKRYCLRLWKYYIRCLTLIKNFDVCAFNFQKVAKSYNSGSKLLIGILIWKERFRQLKEKQIYNLKIKPWKLYFSDVKSFQNCVHMDTLGIVRRTQKLI